MCLVANETDSIEMLFIVVDLSLVYCLHLAMNDLSIKHLCSVLKDLMFIQVCVCVCLHLLACYIDRLL